MVVNIIAFDIVIKASSMEEAATFSDAHGFASCEHIIDDNYALNDLDICGVYGYYTEEEAHAVAAAHGVTDYYVESSVISLHDDCGTTLFDGYKRVVSACDDGAHSYYGYCHYSNSTSPQRTKNYATIGEVMADAATRICGYEGEEEAPEYVDVYEGDTLVLDGAWID